MQINPKLPKEMDQDITKCLEQLAARANELGEPNTAIVLYALVGHRHLNLDFMLAVPALQLVKTLQPLLLDQLKKSTEEPEEQEEP